MGVRERNWLATEANERNRVKAGYGDYEGEEREKTVSSFPWPSLPVLFVWSYLWAGLFGRGSFQTVWGKRENDGG